MVNRIDGVGGGDTIDVASSPADADTVLCRSGGTGFGIARSVGVNTTNTYNDVVTADVLDVVSRSGSTACATVHQPRPAAPRLTVLEKRLVAAGGVFTVPLTCTAAAPRCRVTAQISSARGTILDVARGVIGVGKRAQVLFHLSPMRRLLLAQGRTLHLRLEVDVSDSTRKTRAVHSRLRVRGKR